MNLDEARIADSVGRKLGEVNHDPGMRLSVLTECRGMIVRDARRV